MKIVPQYLIDTAVGANNNKQSIYPVSNLDKAKII